ncbi:TetR/AcrR family transcriptional regulator [Streptomyces sp. B21-108]|uniref:TetR/AcrR family transcriptional regulator n=1 Tax=Streptomyces sp. B21-108 TaxID=3039419 RepID=UPI002FF1D6E2
MGQARARGPYVKTPARRAEIVRAARDSFAERGYANASLRDIAERAGITHAGLLHLPQQGRTPRRGTRRAGLKGVATGPRRGRQP